ncbi:dihydrofolate reductase family protein [Prauserella oleivorans]|uniref:Dihydrofolate reductase family protein n=1 Tax=Prauserella oleivorans TaxID=1478153 RepID=A0ABW5WAX2_9PSEU
MAKLLYSASMSLDGFIAGPGGDMSWLSEYMAPNPPIDGLVGDIGALLIGNRTFRGDDPNKGTENEGAYGGAWEGPQIVVTHHVPDEPVPGVTFAGDLAGGVAAAREAAGEKYVSILGADIARQCLAAGWLDEVLVCVVPVLLGDGVRLFDVPGGTNVKLERIGLSEAALASNLWFRVVG